MNKPVMYVYNGLQRLTKSFFQSVTNSSYIDSKLFEQIRLADIVFVQLCTESFFCKLYFVKFIFSTFSCQFSVKLLHAKQNV